MGGPIIPKSVKAAVVSATYDDQSSSDEFESVLHACGSFNGPYVLENETVPEVAEEEVASEEPEEDVPDVLYVVEYLGAKKDRILDSK
jgi:hypothetical protein